MIARRPGIVTCS